MVFQEQFKDIPHADSTNYDGLQNGKCNIKEQKKGGSID